MNAWLLTWEAWGANAYLAKRIVAVLSSRRSDRSIAEFVELLYERAAYNVTEMAYYANRRRQAIHRARHPIVINGIPHGDRVMCGGNPFLYARRVSEFRVRTNKGQGREVVSWREPPIFRWADERRQAIERAAEGEAVVVERDLDAPVANDLAR